MTNNIPQIMTLSANNIYEYCEKKKITLEKNTYCKNKIIRKSKRINKNKENDICRSGCNI